MIQDILPKHLDNQYRNVSPKSNDIVFFFRGTTILAKPDEDYDSNNPDGHMLEYPQYDTFIQGINALYGKGAENDFSFTYLFAIDEERYFLAQKRGELQKGRHLGEKADSLVHNEYKTLINGYEFLGVNAFRRSLPRDKAFAAITAYHLYGWYRDNQFCGRCGNVLTHDEKERMVKCDCCGNTIYPKICPAVIVAVTDKDRILLTKYVGRTYRNYALIAGFTEIGESTEDTVRREVYEEVGINVKNITYYKSQPWGLSGSQLFGYFCELDGDDTITLEEDELAIGKWVKASDIDVTDDGVSLTREMIEKFRQEHI